MMLFAVAKDQEKKTTKRRFPLLFCSSSVIRSSPIHPNFIRNISGCVALYPVSDKTRAPLCKAPIPYGLGLDRIQQLSANIAKRICIQETLLYPPCFPTNSNTLFERIANQRPWTCTWESPIMIQLVFGCLRGTHATSQNSLTNRVIATKWD